MTTEASTTSLQLTDLPPELLACIICRLGTAQSLSHISQTCKALKVYIETEGYRNFVSYSFPSIEIPASAIPGSNDGFATTRDNAHFWKEAAHGLTTLSRNWDRRALVAQPIQVPAFAVTDTRARRRHGPTIGFMPVIDSYDAWYETGWTSRKEVVAWGAGAKLVLRSTMRGRKAWEGSTGERSTSIQEPHWRTYSKVGVLEGRDDLTAVNLIAQVSDQYEEMVLGRASGSLERLRLGKHSENETLSTYETQGLPVRSASVHRHTGSVLSACLGDHKVALFPLDCDGIDIQPYASASIQEEDKSVRTWSSKFLNKERLAVGLGRSRDPIHIYELGQGDSNLDHVRRLPLDEDTAASRVDGPGGRPQATSVYSFASIPSSAMSSGAEGDVFLSGGYDAHVRYELSNTLLMDVLGRQAKYSF